MPKDSRHFARRKGFVQHNEREGIFDTEWVADADMTSDYLGKWVPQAKYEKSRNHHMNISAQVPITASKNG